MEASAPIRKRATLVHVPLDSLERIAIPVRNVMPVPVSMEERADLTRKDFPVRVLKE